MEVDAVQMFIDHMAVLVEEATIGYTLAMVMNENNLEQGPKMRCMEVNLHDIDVHFMADH